VGGATPSPIFRWEQTAAAAAAGEAAAAAAADACSNGRAWLARGPPGGPRQPPPDHHLQLVGLCQVVSGARQAAGVPVTRRVPFAVNTYTRRPSKSREAVCDYREAQLQPVAAARAGLMGGGSCRKGSV
jgi:hypothetical protein